MVEFAQTDSPEDQPPKSPWIMVHENGYEKTEMMNLPTAIVVRTTVYVKPYGPSVAMAVVPKIVVEEEPEVSPVLLPNKGLIN